MPPRREVKERVKLSSHGCRRWHQRTFTSAKNVDRLLTALLHEQLGMGLPVRKGQAFLTVSAKRFGIWRDVKIPLVLPIDGVWIGTTVLFVAKRKTGMSGRFERREPFVGNDQSIELSVDEAVRRVRKALAEIQYGKIEIKVEAGKPIWVVKEERERVG